MGYLSRPEPPVPANRVPAAEPLHLPDGAATLSQNLLQDSFAPVFFRLGPIQPFHAGAQLILSVCVVLLLGHAEEPPIELLTTELAEVPLSRLQVRVSVPRQLKLVDEFLVETPTFGCQRCWPGVQVSLDETNVFPETHPNLLVTYLVHLLSRFSSTTHSGARGFP